MAGMRDIVDTNDAALAATISASANADTVAAPLNSSSDAAPAPIRREDAATIGRFLLLRKIGEGGMGEVFSGYDEQLDRKVAIKLLHSAYASEETQKRMLREAQALARLSHPNVVTVHEVGETGGDVFVVMEHIDGKTLREWQDEAPRTTDEILAAYMQAGRGLAAVHEAGMVHRDFKPHNAMIDNEGRVRILDFGLAHARGAISSASTNELPTQNALASQLTAEGAISGTPAYMSPEQFFGGALDARSDQFSFCVALHEALYQKLPAPPEGSAKATFPAMATSFAPPPKRDDVPARIAETIMKGLAPDPEARFPNMTTLLEMIEAAPQPDAMGQSRQRILFGLLMMTVMGAWFMAPAEYFAHPTVLYTLFLPSLSVFTVAVGGSIIFRQTLFRNPFHRIRMLTILSIGFTMTSSRGLGVLLHDSLESVALRDLFILCTAIMAATITMVPRVAAVWVSLAIALSSIVAVPLFPQYFPDIITFTMNATFLGYLIAWHRSTRVVRATNTGRGEMFVSGRSNRRTSKPQ